MNITGVATPNSKEDHESLRRKFKALKNVMKPTGDPTCPPDVIRAKHIQRRIEERMGVAELNEDAEVLGPVTGV